MNNIPLKYWGPFTFIWAWYLHNVANEICFSLKESHWGRDKESTGTQGNSNYFMKNEFVENVPIPPHHCQQRHVFFQDNSRYSLWFIKKDNIGQYVIIFMDSIIVLKRNPLRFCLRLCWRERMILWEGKDSRFGLFHFPPHRTRMTRPPAEGEEKLFLLMEM